MQTTGFNPTTQPTDYLTAQLICLVLPPWFVNKIIIKCQMYYRVGQKNPFFYFEVVIERKSCEL